MKALPIKAKVYIVVTVLLGFVIIAQGLSHWDNSQPVRFACYLVVAALASGLKVGLPKITGTMSVNFLFILIGIVELSLPEALLIGCVGTVVQSVWKAKSRVRPVRLLFSLASVAIAIRATYFLCHSVLEAKTDLRVPLLLACAACTYFLLNTFPVAAVIALTEKKSLQIIWRECFFGAFPYYLVGAAIAGVLSTLNRFAGWQVSVLVLPLIYWVYRSHRLDLERLEAGKKHAEEIAGLHLRTIEALALAIEAKDCTTHSHLRRVGVYAVEVGKELGLSEAELEALRAAALLHDIGKLAVPEHIISKPGKLTPVEFEKVKIHPVIGGEILERVNFPYPVAPIVRSHHEKWDGTGYPAGLKGEEIPLGARILSAVDCLDALSSDRQYRRALPLDEAMAKVASESGRSFDPRVVEVLQQRYLELERMVQTQPVPPSRLSKYLKIDRGLAPAAGFENADGLGGPGPVDFLFSIAAARQEAQVLFELIQGLGNSLSVNETLSVLALRLQRMIPYDSIVIYVRRDNKLAPEYVNGEHFRLFSSLEIPIGEGLSGWVAENRKPIVNGNPSVEPLCSGQSDRFNTLHSALSVPLEGVNGVVGVLTLYQVKKDFFTRDHLRILLAITEKLALCIENALKYRQAETCATTDALTELPNARSLFLQLDRELARCKRLNTPLAVLVCDLDGFKQVNDRFGHLVGNKVLRAVARTLQNSCREYDYVARMGGDEFVVVLPGYVPAAAENKSRQLQQVVEEVGQEVCGADVVSASVGIAYFPIDGADAEQLLAEADRRMYKAKQTLIRTKPCAWDLLWESATAVQ